MTRLHVNDGVNHNNVYDMAIYLIPIETVSTAQVEEGNLN